MFFFYTECIILCNYIIFLFGNLCSILMQVEKVRRSIPKWGKEGWGDPVDPKVRNTFYLGCLKYILNSCKLCLKGCNTNKTGFVKDQVYANFNHELAVCNQINSEIRRDKTKGKKNNHFQVSQIIKSIHDTS